MSARIVNEVWAHADVGGNELLCLLALAQWSDDKGGNIYPSYGGLAKKLRLKRRATIYIVARLVASGHLLKQTNAGKHGQNVYQIDLKRLVHVGAPPVLDSAPTCTPLVHGDAPPLVHVGAPNTRKDTRKDTSILSDFEKWWQLYPRKKGKGAARTAYERARKKTDGPSLFSALSSYVAERDGKDVKYTAHPATWLNQERWTDEPEETAMSFYDKLDKALEDEENGLFSENSDYHETARQVSAPIQSTRDGRGNQAGKGESDGRGDQSPYLKLIKPKRFRD